MNCHLSTPFTPLASLASFASLATLSTALLLAGCGDDVVSTAGTDSATTTTVGGTSTTSDTGTTTMSTTTDPSGSMSDSEGTTDGETTTTDPTTTGPTTTDPTTTGPTTTDPTTTDPTTTDATTDATTGGLCPEGTIVCEDGIAKTCDGMGGYSAEELCADECADNLGCVLCIPGSATCEGNNSKLCANDGMSFDEVECDEVQGVQCDENSGSCSGDCAPDTLGLSYIGCDYYPTVTANIVGNNFNFAVAVANTSDSPASVRVDRGANIVTMATVAPNSVQIINLPWVAALKADLNAVSATVPDGAYRLRSDQPVTVYQFNPLEYQLGGSSSFTNDASLLLPVNTWTGDYFVAARNSWRFNNSPPAYPGIYAVTASQDGTTVTLDPSATGGIVRAGGGVAANGTGTIMLDRGDVLQVFSGDSGPNPSTADLSGTHILADKPIQVIGGHICTFVPFNIGYCDHLEESIPPFEALAKDYLVTPPLIPTGGNTPKAQMVRIIATTANTTLTYDPPQGGAPTMIANAGDYVELAQNANDFKISADNKVIVAQYMLGQDAGGNSGDPAMTIAVGVDQYRSNYLFHAPTNYERNFVNVTAPTGATITLNGAPVANFTAIGGTGFSVARVQLDNGGDGNHEIAGNQPFGVSVYGYGQYTSFWYPGGLNLEVLPQ